MSTTDTNRILLTGATGYIGGTVLDYLIKSEAPSIKKLTFDLLVRNKDAAEKLRKAYGNRVNPILWQGFTDDAANADIAANYDIIVNAGTGIVPEGPKAFIDGLARRIKPGHPPPWMIHTSGCSNFSDLPLTETAYPDRVWDDADGEAVFEFLRTENEHIPYPQRTNEISVLAAAEETGVQAISVNSPLIMGTGTGLFNQTGFIIPVMMRYVVQHGHGFKLNDTSDFGWVHVEDLAELYVLIVRTILERDDRGVGYIPSGKNGIISSAVGRVLISEMMQQCLDTAFDAGVLPRKDTCAKKEIRQVSLQEIADEIVWGALDPAERCWAGHKMLKGTVARKKFGWNPTRLEDAFRRDYVDVLNKL